MSGRYFAPIFAGLVGVATGVYIFQPVVLEQLEKDGALRPEFRREEAQIEGALGDVTNPNQPAKNPNFKPPSAEQIRAWDAEREAAEKGR